MYKQDANGNPVPTEDSKEAFAQNRVVGLNEVGDVKVSTVFLVTDHGWRGEPILWETMVFGGEHDEEQWRYGSRAEALAGHEAIRKWVFEGGERPEVGR